jgi:hypothetical protein
MRTYEEICDSLRSLDEITLLEELDISSEDLVDRFPDFIEKKLEFFQQDFEEEDEDTDD